MSAKRAFDLKCRIYGIPILYYHYGNSRFADNAFKNSVRDNGQTVTYYGVNAHFQNGRAENKIIDLREASRKQFIHSINRCPGAVKVHLWAYVLHYACNVQNCMPRHENKLIPLQKFTGSTVDANPKDFHAFGCPVNALNSKLAAGQSIGHWNPRDQLGINLGFSPRHTHTVYYILNLQTATVSPQFHVKHNDFFEYVSAGAGNALTSSLLSTVAVFITTTMPAATIPAAIIPSFVPTDAPIPDFSLAPPTLSQRESNSNNSNNIVPAIELISETAYPTMTSFLSVPIKPAPLEPATNILPDTKGDDTTNNIRRSTSAIVPTQRLQ